MHDFFVGGLSLLNFETIFTSAAIKLYLYRAKFPK